MQKEKIALEGGSRSHHVRIVSGAKGANVNARAHGTAQQIANANNSTPLWGISGAAAVSPPRWRRRLKLQLQAGKSPTIYSDSEVRNQQESVEASTRGKAGARRARKAKLAEATAV